MAVAEERMNQRMAKPIEESDARPARGMEAVGPDGGLDSDLCAEPVRGTLTQLHETSTLGRRLPADDPSTQEGARRRDSLKLHGPRGPDGAITRHSVAVERTSIDDWIGDEDMDLENGEGLPQSPASEPASPRYP